MRANEIGGQFVIAATARPGQELSKVEKEVDEELARFLEGGPEPQELQRVKTQHAAAFIRGVDRIGGFGGKSDVLATGQAFLGDPGAYKVALQRVQDASVQDLKSAARRWLSDGVYILEVHPFPSYKTAAVSADRSKMPETGTPPELKLPKLERATLSNGLKVILAQRHEIPVVDFRLQWMPVMPPISSPRPAPPA
jgi:zinc protease